MKRFVRFYLPPLAPFPSSLPHSAHYFPQVTPFPSSLGQMADSPDPTLPYSWIIGHSGRLEYPQEMKHVQPTITDPGRLL
jgi:hypothetical protein